MPRTYEETLAFLYALEARKGMDFRLSRLDPVLERLGHPEKALACVHVAGTNGKGSTAAMIDGVLRAAGHRTGLYTSPHLVSFRERLRIQGQPISRDAVVRQVAAVTEAMSHGTAELTFFEITTVAALLEMREREVEVAVIEAGLGGRLDVTNVVHGDVAVVTSVGIDHAEYLGSTVGEIAAEKAAIIKSGSTAVTGPLDEDARDVVAARVEQVGARWLDFGRDFHAFAPAAPAAGLARPSLVGAHQAINAGVAAAAVRALSARWPVSPEDLEAGILQARWPGRLEVLAPGTDRGRVVLDAAHNPQAARALAEALDEVAPERPRVLVFAAMADKDWPTMLCVLGPCFDRVFFAPLPMARAEDPARFLSVLPEATVASSAMQAFELAIQAATVHGSVVVAGSIFLLGNLYRAAGGKVLESELAD